MIISWKKDPTMKPIETARALGFRIIHKDKEKTMWIPKSLIKNRYTPETRMIDVSDWFYDTKIDELFFNEEKV